MSNADSPAFPNDGMLPEGAFGWMNGLTKRELFAAMAMQGIMSSEWFGDHLIKEREGLTEEQKVAAKSLRVAEALLAKLEEKAPPAAK